MTKIEMLMIGGLVVAGIAVFALIQQRTSARLRETEAALREQTAVAAQLSAERERLANQLAQAQSVATDDRLNELLRLRNQVRLLRDQTNELGMVQAQNRRLEQALDQARQSASGADDEESADPTRRAAIAKMNDAKHLILAFILYAGEHQDQLPTNLDQVESYLEAGERDGRWPLTRTNQFEIVCQGSTSDLAKPAETIVVRERQAWQTPEGKWAKAYGFADGHSEIRTEPVGGFEAWEAEHMVVPRADRQ